MLYVRHFRGNEMLNQFEVINTSWGRVLTLHNPSKYCAFWGMRDIVAYLDNPMMQARLNEVK
jgi:hypothetical protein